MRMDPIAYRRMWTRYYIVFAAGPTISLILSHFLENMEAERMSRFRDKSALYGRKLAPGEPPSWP